MSGLNVFILETRIPQPTIQLPIWSLKKKKKKKKFCSLCSAMSMSTERRLQRSPGSLLAGPMAGAI